MFSRKPTNSQFSSNHWLRFEKSERSHSSLEIKNSWDLRHSKTVENFNMPKTKVGCFSFGENRVYYCPHCQYKTMNKRLIPGHWKKMHKKTIHRAEIEVNSYARNWVQLCLFSSRFSFKHRHRNRSNCLDYFNAHIVANCYHLASFYMYSSKRPASKLKAVLIHASVGKHNWAYHTSIDAQIIGIFLLSMQQTLQIKG